MIPEHMFSRRNKEKIMWIPLLSGALRRVVNFMTLENQNSMKKVQQNA